MGKSPDNRIADILTELYTIDPDLKRYEADLPKLISALEAHKPEIAINEHFVATLRASLLTQTKDVTRANASSVPSPYLWWLTRLTPVGIALGLLLITLVPEPSHSPTTEPGSVTPPSAEDDIGVGEMRMKTFEATEPEAGDVMLFNTIPADEPLPVPLEVAPPLAGETITVTTLNAPASGWLTVRAETADGIGEILASVIVSAGEQRDLILSLTRPLTYPEMITVTLYTSNALEQFDAAAETVQIDPQSNTPITITVPVISELELEFLE